MRLKAGLGEEYDPGETESLRASAFARLVARPVTRFEAQRFDDPLDGLDDTAKRIIFGRVGDPPGRARTREMMAAISVAHYGHAVPYVQVHSERAPAPDGADETAVDEEWNARVVS